MFCVHRAQGSDVDDWSGDESCRPKRKRLIFSSTPVKNAIVIEDDMRFVHMTIGMQFLGLLAVVPDKTVHCILMGFKKLGNHSFGKTWLYILC